jgi:hypothetical protein
MCRVLDSYRKTVPRRVVALLWVHLTSGYQGGAARQATDTAPVKTTGIRVSEDVGQPTLLIPLRSRYWPLPSNPTLAASLRLLEHRLDRLPERWAFPVLNGWRRLSGAHGVGSWENIDQTCFHSCIEREASAGLTSIALDPQPSPVIPAQHPL